MANLGKLMKQAQQMQSQLKTAQAEIEQMEKTYSVAGAVDVTARGDGHIVSIKIAPAAVDPDDIEGLEDLVLTAVNGAIDTVQQEAQSKMSAIGGGLGGMPGLGL